MSSLIPGRQTQQFYCLWLVKNCMAESGFLRKIIINAGAGFLITFKFLIFSGFKIFFPDIRLK